MAIIFKYDNILFRPINFQEILRRTFDATPIRLDSSSIVIFDNIEISSTESSVIGFWINYHYLNPSIGRQNDRVFFQAQVKYTSNSLVLDNYNVFPDSTNFYWNNLLNNSAISSEFIEDKLRPFKDYTFIAFYRIINSINSKLIEDAENFNLIPNIKKVEFEHIVNQGNPIEVNINLTHEKPSFIKPIFILDMVKDILSNDPIETRATQNKEGQIA